MGEGALEDYLETLGALPEGARQRAEDEALEATRGRLWVPNPGPQTEAYFSEADELLYGGEPGGGKTDLLVGLSLTEHQKSLVLRRTNKEAEKLVERYKEVVGHTNGLNEQRGTWRMPGRLIDIGGCQLESDKQKRKGVPHDLKGFDELPDFSRTQYEFIINWNRSTNPAQRCRVIATANPPTTPEGVWVVERWGPWLDPRHPHPALSGELRWFLRTEDGQEIDVEGRGPFEVGGEMVDAKSRTFIRSRLKDNPDLARTNYASTLNAAGAEMRALAAGDFESALTDAPHQAIPTDWVRAAQDRWTERPPEGIPMCAMAVDASGGGKDPMVLAMRYDGWYAQLVSVPAIEIPVHRAGKHCAGIIVSHRKNQAVVIIDLGGGYGNATFETLVDNEIEVRAYKGAEKTNRRTSSKQLGFTNTRTAAHWSLREALDPAQEGGSPIFLPPSRLLLADLTAPTIELTPRGLQLEPKEKLVERLGRSTNEGDAVVMAWFHGPTYITDGAIWQQQRAARNRRRTQNPQVLMGRHRAARR